MYCEDSSDNEDITERIDELKMVQKNERGTSRNKDQKFY